MTCLLQISDPHFGTEREPVVRALERLSHAQRPAVLVMSGDITQRATRTQFDAARAFVQRLAIPATLAIPGNHDIPLFALMTRVFDPYGRYRRAFGADLEPVIDTPDWLVIGVNTTRWYRHEDGKVSSAQIERVAALLARPAPPRLRIVVVHQPVAVTQKVDLSNLLDGREAAVEHWAAAGADLVLGGHIHLPFVLPLQRMFDSLPRAVWCVQAGTAVSSRVRANAPNSVNLVRRASDAEPGARRCVVERWDYASTSDSFERAEAHTLTLSEDRDNGQAHAA